MALRPGGGIRANRNALFPSPGKNCEDIIMEREERNRDIQSVSALKLIKNERMKNHHEIPLAMRQVLFCGYNKTEKKEKTYPHRRS